MNKFIEKFFAIQSSISKEKGTIRLLVLQELSEFPGKWEMIMSAEWFPESTRKILDFINECSFGLNRILPSHKYCSASHP